MPKARHFFIYNRIGRFMMVRRPIVFLDDKFKPTNNHVEGWPSVRTNIQVGFVPSSDPKALITPQFTEVWAAIDTGSDTTMIGKALAQGHTPLRPVTEHNMIGPGVGSVYRALVQIIDLDKPYCLEVGLASFKSLQMVIGRDLISLYRLVLDTPKGEFYLEKLD
jgi:hypothetical protein